MPDDLPHDPPLFWSVEVETPGWRSWSLRRRRRLRREIETDDRIVRILKLSAQWYPVVRSLAPLYPYVKVEVAAVGEGEAYRFAQGAVDAALSESARRAQRSRTSSAPIGKRHQRTHTRPPAASTAQGG
jgi:hypothetical protein